MDGPRGGRAPGGRARAGRAPAPEAGRPDRPGRAGCCRAGGRISPALRRLVVTPTFAAGLGVVVAAFLAANMSRTVLHFSAPVPGNQCSAGYCHAQEPHGGTLASARPGVHITPSVLASTTPAPGTQSGRTPSALGVGGTPQPTPGRQPLSIRYQQVGQWPGGFADQITISGLSGTGARAWSLAFSYPGPASPASRAHAGSRAARVEGWPGGQPARLGPGPRISRPRCG